MKEKIKRLYRSKDGQVLGGVCSGLGKYFEIDPVIVRLLWVIFTFISVGLGIILYLIAWIIIPEEPQKH